MKTFIANIQSKNDPKDVKVYLVHQDKVGEFLSKYMSPDVVIVFGETPEEFTLN